MTNRETRAILDYHERTKHSVARLQANQHFLDWEIQPRPFKLYRGIEPILLPRKWLPSEEAALTAIGSPGAPMNALQVPDIQTLARLLYFSAGVTRVREFPNGQKMHFRAAACTGALYHIDLYLVCGSLSGLEAGVYHFDPLDFALRCLRAGDYRALVTEATGEESAVAAAPAILVCTSTFWRNAWKYEDRAYRHCFWDNGTLLANLLAVAAADRVPARVVMGFVDETINHLLGLDTQHEVALSLVTLGYQPGETLPVAPPMPPLSFETEPLSKYEVDYPTIRSAHEASCLLTAEEVRRWRASNTRGISPGPARSSPQLSGESPADSIDQVIMRRGSSRRFSHDPISFEQLSALLHYATRGIATDFLDSEDATARLTELYLIINAVNDLSSGTYAFHPDRGDLEALRTGDFRGTAGFLGLGQEIPANASVNFFLLSNLKPILERFGNRGYRAAQLEAAIVGGKLYLAAYAMHLGASGLTFFDDDVTEFFSPHASGKSVMFLLAAGKAARGRPI